MSANAEVLQGSGLLDSPARETTSPPIGVCSRPHDWNPQDFACEQIRGLVRQVFFTHRAAPIRQVVFSAADPQTDVAGICHQVGRALSLETNADIAIVDRSQTPQVTPVLINPTVGKVPIKSSAGRLGINLWRVPQIGSSERDRRSGSSRYWLAFLAELRDEFEYVVIHGEAAGVSSEAALLGHISDGIILVLDAQSTRRATARKIKETLESAQSRILGTVLCERTFPVPERLYRRL
jgi:hypothetical protein